jgi:hypothetical protein
VLVCHSNADERADWSRNTKFSSENFHSLKNSRSIQSPTFGQQTTLLREGGWTHTPEAYIPADWCHACNVENHWIDRPNPIGRDLDFFKKKSLISSFIGPKFKSRLSGIFYFFKMKFCVENVGQRRAVGEKKGKFSGRVKTVKKWKIWIFSKFIGGPYSAQFRSQRVTKSLTTCHYLSIDLSIDLRPLSQRTLSETKCRVNGTSH